MATRAYYSQRYPRYDILSPMERYEVDKEFRNRVINPFKRGDRVETTRITGEPLKTGVYEHSTYATNGALTCYIRLDESPQLLMSRRYSGLRHEQKALAIYKQCTAIVLYDPPPPKPSNIIPMPTEANVQLALGKTA